MPSLLRRLGVLEKLHTDSAQRAPICIGGDLEKAGACLALQVGAESVAGTITLCRAEVVVLVKEIIARGWHVAVGVEACGFGWLFQAQLREAGAEVFTCPVSSYSQVIVVVSVKIQQKELVKEKERKDIVIDFCGD